jgi:exodeoxyribonuclease V beta subunit
MQLVYAAIAPIKQRYEQQKQQRQLLTFDDLISRLATILSSTDGHNLAQQLYQQYPVALVDEFQDTDAQQYQILQAIYHQPDDAGLFLIGDPKQAIYGFRGGDIFTYLAAKLHCDGQWFMNTNWRSSTNMITAYNRLFYGAPLHEASADVFGFGIAYQPVEPSPLAAVDDEPALHFIHFEPSAELIDSKGAVKASYRTVMAAWCAEKIVSLLNKQQLTSGDIAILVRDSTEAREIKQALHERQLPSVFLSTRDNLYQSNESYALLRCLKGILYLEDDQQFTAALASDLIQLPASQLYSLQQDPMAWQRRKTEFLSLRQCWQQQSFITMALTLLHQQSHMVSEQNERALTNYLHLFELLQQASKQHPQPDALIYWFENQIQQTDNQAEAELRLESDENLIKIVTQHGSKGLEYHTVFIPFATRFNHPLKHGSKYVSLLTYHDAQQLRFHLGMDTEIAELHQREALAETIRLFYVAVTRAKSQCYILSAPFAQYDQSPLGLTLQLAEGEPLATKLQQLVHSITPTACLEIIEQDEITQCTRYEHKQQQQAVQVAQFHGKIERDWWLSSFSALTRQLAHSSVSIPDHDYLPLDQQMSHVAVDSIQFKLKKGAQTGNYLHYLFENMAFNQQPDSEWLTRSSLKFGLLLTEQEISELQQWLQQILTTDLAPNNFSLQHISPKACLKEVEFYFPMQGGKQQQLVKLLTAHRHQVHQQLAEQYGEQYRTIMPVELPSYHQLKGMMHGFIDLVFEHDGRYFVLDYKSSFLGEQLKDYHPVALTLHAEQNYYDLQYLIYCLALDKYLAQRVDNYDSAKHFGGVYYLYLRGMQAQQTYGILHAQLSPEIFSQLRTIFDPQVNQATK